MSAKLSLKKHAIFLLWKITFNQDESVARLCHQVVVFIPDMFWNSYLVKRHKIATNTANTEDREEWADLEYLESFYVCLSKF
jgi:hypothetical protein